MIFVCSFGEVLNGQSRVVNFRVPTASYTIDASHHQYSWPGLLLHSKFDWSGFNFRTYAPPLATCWVSAPVATIRWLASFGVELSMAPQLTQLPCSTLRVPLATSLCPFRCLAGRYYGDASFRFATFGRFGLRPRSSTWTLRFVVIAWVH